MDFGKIQDHEGNYLLGGGDGMGGGGAGGEGFAESDYDELLRRGLFEDTRGGGGDGGDWDIVDLYGAGRVISTSKPRNPMKSSVSQSFNFRRAEYL